jgi:hypothetical protein
MQKVEFDPAHIAQRLGCGRPSVEVLRSFLEKKISFRQLRNRCQSLEEGVPSELETNSLACFVLQNDLDYEALKKGTKIRKMVGRSIYFTILPRSTERVACLQWHRDWLGKESWTPTLIRAEHIKTAHAFFVSEPWLEVLCRLQERPLQRLLDCLKFSDQKRTMGITDEIQKRLSQFGPFRHAFYFQSIEDTLAWHIAEHWPTWEQSKASMDKRRLAVSETWSINLTPEEFKRLIPSHQIEKLKNPPQKSAGLSFAGKLVEKIFKLFDERPIDKHYIGRTKKGVDIYGEPNPFPFSRGGYFEEFLFRDDGSSIRRFPEVGALSTEGSLKDTLWWWRNVKDWPDQLRDEFPDNWERSAFLYELRARLLPDHTWDIFEGPWFQLDVSQRAVLYYLWPPDRQGKHWREGRIWSDTPGEHEFLGKKLEVNPVASGAQIFRAMSKENHYFRHELLGISDIQTRKKSIKKDWRWRLIEALDLHHFCYTTLTNAEIKAKRRAVIQHQEACAQTGLPPDH